MLIGWELMVFKKDAENKWKLTHATKEWFLFTFISMVNRSIDHE